VEAVRAGRLRESIQIQRYTSALDDFGAQTKTYSLLETVRAEVKPVAESEKVTGGKTEGRTQYKILIRYTDINKKDRIVWDGLSLEIIEVTDLIRRKEFLTIKAMSDG